MRLGILGGTFDPVHYGHLLLAETCREQAGLDEVWFLPTAVPPHKQHRPLTAGEQRVEMLELALGGHTALRVCRYEVDRGGVNYTVDTLAHLHAEDSSREIYFLLGADSLHDLPNWKEPERLSRLATYVVVGRRGTEPASPQAPSPIPSLRTIFVEMPAIELASQDLRARIAAGQSIRYRTPRAVEKYIETHGLYRGEGERPEARGER